MTAVIVIPARYGSTRFPGKPLVRQTGKFMIQHVVERAKLAKRAARVVVATDDSRIFDAVRSFGGEAVMTADTHQSGTDRIAEVMRKPEFLATKIVVNVQGDEPEIDPQLIDDLIRMVENPAVPMATAASPMVTAADIANPNQVKAVIDQHHFALYFSRSVIPCDRDNLIANATPETLAKLYRRHLGIYAYHRDFLLKLAATPVCDLERLEKLEQLRALHLGAKIYVIDIPTAPCGIDTPEDYAAFVQRTLEAQP